MRRSKHFWLAVVCLLFAGLDGNVRAQGKTAPYPGAVDGQVGPVGSATTNAWQISDGQTGFDFGTQSNTTFGVGFLGQTFGDFPGSLTISLNLASAVGTNRVEGSSTGSITGGFWTLPVYKTDVRGGFVGSIYGTIVQGQITPTENPNKMQVSMTFDIQGGTLAYQGATGRVIFTGTLTTDGRSNGNELEGTLVFNATD